MICQDLVRHYGRKSARPACLMKIDLQKAYDTLDWDFLQEMLMALKFPSKFIELIMACVTTPRFSFMINGSINGYLSSKRGLRQGDPMSPLIFVIGMEYLSRILVKVTEHQRFKFHPRCEGLRLTHLCFADDLLLFSKGDFDSALLLLKGFQLFSDSSGLIANKGKSAIYGAMMQEETWVRLTGITGFKRGLLPFNYLGMKISNKRITKADCECLVDKMMLRIRTWSTRNLSFARRCVLINSVLFSINTYWSLIVILSKAIVKRINQLCRAFLWKGRADYDGPGQVAWEETCKPKKNGGLGFRDVGLWNKCAVGKFVWAIEKKEDNLWVKWIHNVYLKEKEWWSYMPPPTSSWYWSKVVRIKEEFRAGLVAAEFRKNTFSIAALYSRLKSLNETRWNFTLIWDRMSSPKHKFIAWLALKKRLQTKDRLRRFGFNIDTCCVLCGQVTESHEHLFYGCAFSTRCIHEVLNWLGIGNNLCQLRGIVNWVRRCGHSKCRRRMYLCPINASVYHIWCSRNDALWNSKSPIVTNVIRTLKREICSRFTFIDTKGISKKDIDWVGQLLCN
ncbi:uncharacterized protein LOC133786042 [Humulus lupulus]|uniref:uncharacterized protein LOC133786042 n=1 Tax=Humulus lupulus TaxID=3486 RepID=UPI002B413AE7|nr:uncharacterized protein LOC133786042 [Humulus lupulus]